ncbi:hypothetical protein [Nitrosomonas aestuarii]|uniref:hypothetical protein n=1 Tax=Nitrosomonas aestuarii TaxID=52441 RepID=UPI00147C48A8|nr:hypothetical protein [Nitrosomonas aestuarii]
MARKKTDKKPPKIQQHDFRLRICHWPYCANCGLVLLKNERTAAAVKKGCDG